MESSTCHAESQNAIHFILTSLDDTRKFVGHADIIHCMTMKIHQSFSLVALGLVPLLLFCTVRVLAQGVPEVVPHVVVVQFEAGISLPGKTSTTGLQVFDRRAAAYGVHAIERMYPFLDQVNPTPKTQSNLLALRRTYYVRYKRRCDP